MSELIYLALLFFAVVVWPVWLFRRMRKVRQMTAGPDRDNAERRSIMPAVPFVDETLGDDGLVYARPMESDPDLISADARARELPAIENTLIGKR